MFTSIHKIMLAVVCGLGATGNLQALDNCNVQIAHRGDGPVQTIESWSGSGESLLFVGEGAVLRIYNVANPSAPIRMGEIGLSGSVAHIAVRPNGLLVAVSDRKNTIRLVDVTNRNAPTLLSEYPVPEGRIPRGMAISGNTLYAAISPAGLSSINITNPTAPTLRQQIITPGANFVFDVKISGTRAYVVGDVEGLSVWNIATPSNMTALNGYPAATGAQHLFIDGTRAFVARQNQGYDILDISGATPVLLGSLPFSGGFFSGGILVNGHLVTRGDFSNGLRTFNISNPASPQLVSSLTNLNTYIGLASMGNIAWVGVRNRIGNDFRAYDFGNPANPTVQSNTVVGGRTETVHVDGERIYVPQFPRGLEILSNQEGTRGTLLGRYDVAKIYHVSTQGNIAYVISSQNFETTLHVLDVTNPATIVQLNSSSLPFGSTVYQMAIQTNRLYIASSAGVRIYDISTPSTPSFLTTYGTLALAVLPEGNRLYVGLGDGFEVVNISGATPSLLGQFNTGRPANDFAVSGQLLYVADGNQAVSVFDTSNPTGITISNVLDVSPGLASGLAIDGQRLYVATGPFWGTIIADISNPVIPVQVGNLSTPATVLDVAFGNGALVAAEEDIGVRIHFCPSGPSSEIFKNGFE